MELPGFDRRLSIRHKLRTALRLRIWKSGTDEQRAVSEDLSVEGAFFATDAPLHVGSAVEILFKMPEEITGKPASDWRCTGHVVRIVPLDSATGKSGVGVHFDCHAILRSKAPPST